MDYRWTCGCCNKQFDTLPLDRAFEGPHHWAVLSEDERQRSSRIDSDICTIATDEGRQIFIRGCIEIPIIGHDEVFAWGVWASVSEQSFARILELWDVPVGEDEPARFGYLCNSIPGYPETLLLHTNIRLRNDGMRPAIELHRSEHPLFLDQQNGIPLRRVEEIAAASRVH